MPPARHFAEQMMPSASCAFVSIALRAPFQALPRFSIFAAATPSDAFHYFSAMIFAIVTPPGRCRRHAAFAASYDFRH
jgi:hypothetical protein